MVWNWYILIFLTLVLSEVLLLDNYWSYNSSKEQILQEFLSTTTKSVIFLNSKMEIIRINEFARKKFNLYSAGTISFYDFSKTNNLNNTYQHGQDIAPVLRDMLMEKFAIELIPKGKSVSWRIEYFPELFDTDFKLGLIEIVNTVQKTDNLLSNAVYESVNSMVQQIATDKNFDSVLYNIVKSLPGRAHIKLASDFSYHITNSATLKLLGMKNAQELVGKCDYAVAKHMGSYWPAKLAQEIQDLDQAIITNNCPIIGKEETPYLDAEGNLVIHSLTKIPIFNMSNEPYGILTLAVDISHMKDLMFVRQAYRGLFKNAREAHHYFIRHIGLHKIHADENDLITIRELECLILFSKGMTAKEIGLRMDISYRTVETHFENIKLKFNCLTRSEVISLFLAHSHF